MRRWIEDDALPPERQLLEALSSRDVEPPDGCEETTFAALLARLDGPGGGGDDSGGGNGGPAAGGDPTGGGAPIGGGATAAGSAGLLKTIAPGLAVGMLAGAVFSGGAMLIAPPRGTPSTFGQADAPAAERSVPPTRAVGATGESSKTTDGEPVTQGASVRRLATGSNRSGAVGSQAEAGPATPQAPDASPANAADPGAAAVGRFVDAAAPTAAPREPNDAHAARRSQLAAERKQLERARQMLGRGQAAQALGVLTAAEQRFPRAYLYQEREALAIRALAKAGHRAQARSRARRFLKRFPNSPLAAPVQSYAR